MLNQKLEWKDLS